jgi:hypothetical protein
MNLRKWAALAVLAAYALVAQIPGGGNVNINITTAGGSNLTTAGAVTFVGAPNVLTSDEINFFWDSINYRLGIGTATPTAPLTVTGSALIQGLTVGRGGGAVSSNTAVGASALASNTTGGNNTASGVSALLSNTTGNFNTASGASALLDNTTGNDNTASGADALRFNTTGNNNTASGYTALRSNTTGNNNTASGRDTLRSNTTGNNNAAFGRGAGYTANIANANTTGSNNTWIGYQSGPGSPTQHNNSVAIGYFALVDASNAGVLGTAGMKWSVGGVQAPATTFHVEDTTASTGVTNVLVKAGAGQSTTDLQQWQASGGTVLARVTSGGDIAFRIATFGAGTEAVCDATTRGQVVMVQGGAGVADTLRVCRKDAANAYAWTALY